MSSRKKKIKDFLVLAKQWMCTWTYENVLCYDSVIQIKGGHFTKIPISNPSTPYINIKRTGQHAPRF